MDQASATPFVPRNVAELVAHVGNVPGGRIRLSPTPGSATEANLLRACEKEKRSTSLVCTRTVNQRGLAPSPRAMIPQTSEVLRKYISVN